MSNFFLSIFPQKPVGVNPHSSQPRFSPESFHSGLIHTHGVWTRRIISSETSDLHFTSLAENKHNIMKDPSSTSSTTENKPHTSSVIHFSTKALVYTVHCSPRNVSWCLTWNLLFIQQLPYHLQQKEISCAEECWLHGKEEEQEESYAYNLAFFLLYTICLGNDVRFREL